MELNAVFETWHLGDGNYPALAKGMLVNLSFEIEPHQLQRGGQAPSCFEHLGEAEYGFSGEVLRVYRDDGDPLIVIACGEFQFYILSPLTRGLVTGDRVHGKGTLVLDHYIWVEFLGSYADPPDLFYNLRVDAIKRIKMPERFIMRSGNSISYPARIQPSEYGPDSVTEVDRIEDAELCHYIVRFSDQGLPDVPIARTFL